MGRIGGGGEEEGEIVKRRRRAREAIRRKRIRVISSGVTEAPGAAKRDFIVDG